MSHLLLTIWRDWNGWRRTEGEDLGRIPAFEVKADVRRFLSGGLGASWLVERLRAGRRT